jgi:hypothetical protein
MIVGTQYPGIGKYYSSGIPISGDAVDQVVFINPESVVHYSKKETSIWILHLSLLT